jgi:triosephosphate isomerase
MYMAEQPRKLLAGNWKMNGLTADLAEIAAIRDAVAAWPRRFADVVVCVPATLLAPAAELCAGSPVAVGGQDCHAKPCGAHTGDIAAEMLKDAGAAYVITGHSERRTDHGETDWVVRDKTAAGFRAGLNVILCVGETETERASGAALLKVGTQLAESLPKDVPAGRLAIAYEPVWAIGTGHTPTPRDVGEMHDFIRDELYSRLGADSAGVRLLYGGSVKPANAAELLTIRNVDGALVGGASLKAAEFLAIGSVYAA